MDLITLIYDPLEEKTVHEKIIPAFKDYTIDPVPYHTSKKTCSQTAGSSLI
ncbi:hypothetical protein GCM10028895_05260 [Pontibacter rugosus]